MMLEGTDAKVHCIYHTPQMAEARGRGGLRTNRFVRLRKRLENGRPLLEINELGHSGKILNDRQNDLEWLLLPRVICFVVQTTRTRTPRVSATEGKTPI